MVGSVRDIHISSFIAEWSSSPFREIDASPWQAVASAESIIRNAIGSLGSDYHIQDGIAVHQTATLEAGCVVKSHAIIGPRCFIAAGAYLRAGVFIAEDCIIGPAAELKTSFIFSKSKLAHLNFVGDSILGSDVNIEAGAVIANYRNERSDKIIRIATDEGLINTGVVKFGALVGDGCRVGANAVIAPGAVLPPHNIVGRLQLVDQSPL